MTNEERATREELAQYYEDLKKQGKELDNLVPVKARVSLNFGIIYSVRFTQAEMDRISRKATSKEMKVSAFIRSAALSAAEDDLDLATGERASHVLKVKEQVKALSEAVKRL